MEGFDWNVLAHLVYMEPWTVLRTCLKRFMYILVIKLNFKKYGDNIKNYSHFFSLFWLSANFFDVDLRIYPNIFFFLKKKKWCKKIRNRITPGRYYLCLIFSSSFPQATWFLYRSLLAGWGAIGGLPLSNNKDSGLVIVRSAGNLRSIR
jgi:hypothetical protein